MLYIIYKTTNLINNHFYIGKHQCETLNDGYIGSGKRLLQAIKKYGRKNFVREILFIFDNEFEMNLKEKELVTEDLVKDPSCYNMTLGGEGGPIFLGKHHSEQTKQILREKRKLRKPYKMTEEAIEKKKQTQYLKNNGNYFSEETKRKLSEARKRYLDEHPEKIKHDRKNKRSPEEVNKSRSEKLLGHAVSEDTRKKLSEANKGQIPKNLGKIQINNGFKNVYINIEDLDRYLAEGWEKGRYQTKLKNK